MQNSWQELKSFPLPEQRLFAYPYGIRCRTEIETRLADAFELDCPLGGRFTLKDNKSETVRWERELMELSAGRYCVELTLIPVLRSIKDKLSGK